jgi:transcription termination factor NusB
MGFFISIFFTILWNIIIFIIILMIMKKIEIPLEVKNKIIDDYNINLIGSPTLSEKYNISKRIILTILKDGGCDVGSSGRKFKGGKKDADKRYYEKNKTTILNRYKKWKEENKEKVNEYHKEWRQNNDNYKSYKRLYQKELKKNNPQYKLSQNIFSAIYSSLKEKNIKKDNKYFESLGYTIEDLKQHIESLFKPNMSWENYGDWHIDHIIPQSKFNYTSLNDLEFKDCWGLHNLQPLWSHDNLSKNNRIVSHQYNIRKDKETIEKNSLPFDTSKVNLNNSILKVIDRKTAEPIIKEYEWLGYLPKYCNHYFGLYFIIDDCEYLGGVVALQPEYGENLGVWDKYGYTGKIIQLSRGVCLWWTPKNSASFMISRVVKWLKNNTKYSIITATVDPNAGEIGTIYQSLNWIYVGVFGGNLTSTGKERIRYGYIINGKLYNQRHIRSKIGSAKKEEVLKHFPNVEIINLGRKRRYFYFFGSKVENKKYMNSIKNLIQTYPNR